MNLYPMVQTLFTENAFLIVYTNKVNKGTLLENKTAICTTLTGITARTECSPRTMTRRKVNIMYNKTVQCSP